MLGHAIAILALGALCAVWVLLQNLVARHDPEQPGVEGGCGNCHGNGECSGAGGCHRE